MSTTLTCPVQAEPYIPSGDSEILETLPAPGGYAYINALRRQIDQYPGDLRVAVAVINSYIDMGRKEGDPRFWGYGEAALAPLIAKGAPGHDNPDLLLLKADLLQHHHNFTEALALLDKVVEAQPNNTKALLMRALIHTARGNYEQARGDCRRSIGGAGLLIGVGCLAQLDSLSGKLKESYDALKTQYLAHKMNASDEEKSWVLDSLGDMAARLGDAESAEGWYKEALLVNAADYYARAAYADLLLDSERYSDTVALTQDFTRLDSLLLRVALAEKRMNGQKAKQYAGMLAKRYREALERGDTAHWRDFAAYFLTIESDPRKAYELASENWQTQKEPADALILLDAAVAAGQKEAAQAVVAWQRDHKREDARFEKLRLAKGL